VRQARKIVAAYAEAQKAGRGSFEVDGKMIDIPVVERARAVLLRHEAIEQRAPAGSAAR
jgi:citrate lyase subunit beta/citryl-CoA lyase